MAKIFAISRYRMGIDGKGVRTLVCFKSCPLNCHYCINDQCHDYYDNFCVYGVDELVSILEKDELYFLMTGGGVTFSGGEPLLEAEFIQQVCGKMNSKISKAIETSLQAPWEDIQLLLKDIDCWFIDLKDLDEEIYKAYTGKSNDLVLDNLEKLLKHVPANKICLRIPYIPGYNDLKHVKDEVAYILEIISCDVKIDVFDYIETNI